MFFTFHPRMGSFNSAPKINNVDSQDDGLELPKGLSTDALLDHVRQLHGSGVVKPSLLSRCFLKPPLNSDDVTDGLRCLQLNSVSRGKLTQSNRPPSCYSHLLPIHTQFAVLPAMARSTFDCCSGTFSRKVSTTYEMKFYKNFYFNKIS